MRIQWRFRGHYDGMKDHEIVELATKPAEKALPNGEAVAYLLCKRYEPLLWNLYNKVFDGKAGYYNDCLDDLYDYLHGKGKAWQKLEDFRWESSFKTWLNKTAYNRFLACKHEWLGNQDKTVSINDDNPDKPKVQLPDNGEEAHERVKRQVLVIEAISLLTNIDQKLAMLKQLEGFSSEEIAQMIQKRWDKEGIVRYGYVRVEGQEHRVRRRVVPNARYVDSLTEHARTELKQILEKLMRKD